MRTLIAIGNYIHFPEFHNSFMLKKIKKIHLQQFHFYLVIEN